MIASFAVFGVMAHVSGSDDSEPRSWTTTQAYPAKIHSLLPSWPSAWVHSRESHPLGWVHGKILYLHRGVSVGPPCTLLCIAVIGVVISIYYYFGWIRAAFFDSRIASSEAKPAIVMSGLAKLALGLLALASVVLGFYQGPFGTWLTSR